jgi:hypothetical protein
MTPGERCVELADRIKRCEAWRKEVKKELPKVYDPTTGKFKGAEPTRCDFTTAKKRKDEEERKARFDAQCEKWAAMYGG